MGSGGWTSPTFALINGAGTTLQTETETALADVDWSTDNVASKAPVAVTAAGTYALKVSATGQDATNTGDFYRCGITCFLRERTP